MHFGAHASAKCSRMRFVVVDRGCEIGAALALVLLLGSPRYLLGAAGMDIPMHDLSDVKHSGRPQGRRLITQQWCVAKANLDNADYQGALDWVCGPLSGQGQVNCGPIQSGQNCYLPNTYQSHASWAFNLYYQTHGQTSQACDFQGSGVITTSDPSTSTCPFVGTNVTTTIVSNSTITNGGHHTMNYPGTSLSALVSVIAYLFGAHDFVQALP